MAKTVYEREKGVGAYRSPHAMIVLGFWIPHCGFWTSVTGFWIPYQWNVDSGLQSLAGLRNP